VPHTLLPTPSHAQRLPPDIGHAQLARIRHAVHHLPQLVKPADYLADKHADFETHLDTLGLVLLQKPVPGQRPSRWIGTRRLKVAGSRSGLRR
jgi:ATP-dependent RNA helicase SUPV3L1/SUV3